MGEANPGFAPLDLAVTGALVVPGVQPDLKSPPSCPTTLPWQGPPIINQSCVTNRAGPAPRDPGLDLSAAGLSSLRSSCPGVSATPALPSLCWPVPRPLDTILGNRAARVFG